MEYEIKPVSSVSLGLKELWDFRELFYYFTWRDIKVKYKQTFLGILWAVLQPFILMVVFSVFFGQALRVPSDNIPYPIFVFSGLLLWNLFSAGLANSANSMVNNAHIIKKIYFPRLIIPLSAILTALFDLIFAFLTYIGLLIYYQYPISLWVVVFFPFSIFITILTSFGLGAFLAALNIKYRDFKYIIPFLIQVLLFLTPVIYPVSIINYDWLQDLLMLNPMAGAIELMRCTITGVPVNWGAIGASAAVSILFFLVGLIYFRKTEYYFADLA